MEPVSGLFGRLPSEKKKPEPQGLETDRQCYNGEFKERKKNLRRLAWFFLFVSVEEVEKENGESYDEPGIVKNEHNFEEQT